MRKDPTMNSKRKKVWTPTSPNTRKSVNKWQPCTQSTALISNRTLESTSIFIDYVHKQTQGSHIYLINPPCQLMHPLQRSPACLRGSMSPPASLTGLSQKLIFGPPAMPLNGQEKSELLLGSASVPHRQTHRLCLQPSRSRRWGSFHWPPQHKRNLLDTLATMSSLPSLKTPHPPPVVKFGTGHTL